MKLKVYTASKLSDGPLWRRLAEDWPEIEFVARWPFHHVTYSGKPDWPEDCAAHGRVFWQHDHEDVLRSDIVLVYTQSEQPLKGALIEAGMALGSGRSVVVVGEHPSYPTWWFHKNVSRVKSLEEARSLLRLMNVGNETPDHLFDERDVA